MKNLYIKPEVEIVLLETESLMLSVSGTYADGDKDALGNDLRYTWDDLWSE